MKQGGERFCLTITMDMRKMMRAQTQGKLAYKGHEAGGNIEVVEIYTNPGVLLE